MKSIAILSLILVGAFCATSIENHLAKDLFNQWKLAHNKAYKSGHEEEFRFNIFLKNYLAIQTHNQKNDGVTLALNHLADLTEEEFANLHATLVPQENNNDEQFGDLEFFSLSNTPKNLPETVDWRDKGAVSPVGNTLLCGSSWAFAAAGALEGLYAITHGKLIPLSVQNLVDCDTKSYGCNGGTYTSAFEYSAKGGLNTDEDYPYVARKIPLCTFEPREAIKVNSGYVNVTSKSVVALKTAVAAQPVAVGIQALNDVFRFYRTGVITGGCGDRIDHAVLVVGYETVNGEEAFIVKNSWGVAFGKKGYALISTNATANNGNGVCGILSGASYPIL